MKTANDLFNSFLFQKKIISELLATFLSRNRPALDSMLAEVRSQSADDLTDSISAAEERKYSYSHYYGNRCDSE